MPFAVDESIALQTLLTRTAVNSAVYAALTGNEGLCEISEQAGYGVEAGYRLIRVDHRLPTDSGDKFEIALVDDAEASVAYYLEVTLAQLPGVCSRHVVRSQAWRSANERHSLVLHEISKTVLFGYLIRHYDVLLVMEDAVTSGDYFYWYRQASRAIEGGFHVYVLDRLTQTLWPISTQRALDSVQDQIWSDSNQCARQVLVSINPLENQW